MSDGGITRIYQFLSDYQKNNLGADWKADADRSGDGTLIKAEVYSFLADKITWGADENKKDDIINKFWASINTNVSGKISTGSKINNKTALDEKEIVQVEKMMKISKQIDDFMSKSDKQCPAEIKDKIKDTISWRSAVKEAMLEKAMEHIKANPNVEELSEAELTEFYNGSVRYATAELYINQQKLDLGIDPIDPNKKLPGYKVEDDETLKHIINQYLYSLKDDETSSMESIISKVDSIIASYADTANTNQNTSVIEEYGYDKDGRLNDLQKETLKSIITNKISTYLAENVEGINVADYKSQIENFVDDYLNLPEHNQASKFVELKNFDINAFVNSDMYQDLLQALKDKEDATRAAEQEAKDAEYKAAFSNLAGYIDDIEYNNISSMTLSKPKIHTEFGMDASGNIVFEQKETNDVYDALVKTLIRELKQKDKNAFDAIGETNIKKLIQSAWITTYNDSGFLSNQWNSTKSFISTVLDNFEKIMNKLSQNPEYLKVYTEHTAYANGKLTSNLEFYGNEETYGDDAIWIYEGFSSIASDGGVYWDSSEDAVEYNREMHTILDNIKHSDTYKDIDEDILTSVFREAQEQALKACVENKNDCPYGTTYKVDNMMYENFGTLFGNSIGEALNPNAPVAKAGEDWSGLSREDDGYKISPKALIELTLYYFDKLLYQRLLG